MWHHFKFILSFMFVYIHMYFSFFNLSFMVMIVHVEVDGSWTEDVPKINDSHPYRDSLFIFWCQGLLHLVFTKFLQDLRNMLTMFGLALGVHQDIINVDQNKAIEVLSEHWGGIDQAVGYDPVLVMASWGHKGSFPFVSLSYTNEVVRASKVQFREDPGSAELFGLGSLCKAIVLHLSWPQKRN